MLDMLRYIVALFTLSSMPPAFLLWVCIHPFAEFWRKFGFIGTYSLLGIPAAGLMTGIVLSRRTFLAIDFGTNYITVFLSLFCVAGAVTIIRQRRKQLTFSTLAGIPELSPTRYPGTLLTDGIYARIRHPRYLEICCWFLGFVLFANNLATYVLLILSIPGLYVLITLEERELYARFGAQYAEYCRRVPRFVPKLPS